MVLSLRIHRSADYLVQVSWITMSLEKTEVFINKEEENRLIPAQQFQLPDS